MLLANVLYHLAVHICEEVTQASPTRRRLKADGSLNTLVHDPFISAQFTVLVLLFHGSQGLLYYRRLHFLFLHWLLLFEALLDKLSLQVADLALELRNDRAILLNELLIALCLLQVQLFLLPDELLCFLVLLSFILTLLLDQVLRDLVLDLACTLGVLQGVHRLFVAGVEL